MTTGHDHGPKPPPHIAAAADQPCAAFAPRLTVAVTPPAPPSAVPDASHRLGGAAVPHPPAVGHSGWRPHSAGAYAATGAPAPPHRLPVDPRRRGKATQPRQRPPHVPRPCRPGGHRRGRGHLVGVGEAPAGAQDGHDFASQPHPPGAEEKEVRRGKIERERERQGRVGVEYGVCYSTMVYIYIHSVG